MALSDPIYQAIEIAVRATGQSAVDDLEARLRDALRTERAWQDQLKAGTITSATYIANTEKVHGQIDKLSQSVEAARRVMAGLPASLADAIRAERDLADAADSAADSTTRAAAAGDKTNKASQAAARGVLELARGFEDLTTGGFLGVLNNIPGTIQNFGTAAKISAGAVAGLTAGASALGTAGYIVYQNWDKVAGLFNTLVPPRLIDDMRQAKDELKALTDKTWKTAVDFQDVRNLGAEIRKAAEEQATLNRLRSGKTEAEEERSKLVTEAIAEGGGAEGVIRAVESATPVTDSEATQKMRAKVAEMDALVNAEGEAQVKARGGSYADEVSGRYADLTRAGRTKVRDSYLNDLKPLEAVDRENRLKGAESVVARAGQGDDAARARLQQLFEANPQAFTNRGVSPEFGQSLRDASPKGVVEKRRIDEAYEESIRAVDESIANVKGFFKGVRDATKRARDADKDAVDLNYRLAVQESQQINDRRRAEGRDEKKDDSDKMKAMRSIAQSNMRRSRETDPERLEKAADRQARAEQRGARADVAAFKKNLADLATLGEITKMQEAEILRANGFAVEAARIMQQVTRTMKASRPHRSHRPTNLPNIDQ